MAQDTTTTSQLTDAVAQDALVLRAILNTAVDGVITIDDRGIMLSFNPAASRLFGYAPEEVIGRNVSMLMPEPDRSQHDRYLENYLRTGAAKIIGIGREVVARRKDGSTFPMDLAVSEVRLGDRRIFAGITRDLTERHNLQYQILQVSDREQQRIGRDLHDGLGQLLAGVGFLAKSLEQRLASKHAPETPDAREIADLMTQAIQLARGLAKGLHPVDMHAKGGLMSALRELSANVTRMTRITCTFRFDQPVLVTDGAAATHLYRIAQEAVNNALRHGKATQVTIELARDEESVALRVEDNGTGIPAVLPPTRGMGLQIMQSRAAILGGSLTFRPGAAADAAGTVVTCRVPRRRLCQTEDAP